MLSDGSLERQSLVAQITWLSRLLDGQHADSQYRQGQAIAVPISTPCSNEVLFGIIS